MPSAWLEGGRNAHLSRAAGALFVGMVALIVVWGVGLPQQLADRRTLAEGTTSALTVREVRTNDWGGVVAFAVEPATGERTWIHPDPVLKTPRKGDVVRVTESGGDWYLTDWLEEQSRQVAPFVIGGGLFPAAFLTFGFWQLRRARRLRAAAAPDDSAPQPWSGAARTRTDFRVLLVASCLMWLGMGACGLLAVWSLPPAPALLAAPAGAFLVLRYRLRALPWSRRAIEDSAAGARWPARPVAVAVRTCSALAVLGVAAAALATLP